MTTVDRILELVNESGLTAKEFAINCKIAGGSITDWKTGRSKPSVESLQKIAKYANVRLEWLTGDSEYKTTEDIYNKFVKNKNEIIVRQYIIDNAKLFMKLKFNNDMLEEFVRLILDVESDEDALIVKFKNYFKKFSPKKQKYIQSLLIEVTNKLIDNEQDLNFYYNLKTLMKQEKQVSNLTKTSSNNIFNIPVIGKISAGQPILAEEYRQGVLPVDPNIYGLTTSEDLFYLLVSGDSMDRKVENGDYVLVHKQDYAEDGDIIVAIVNDDDEATLKRYKVISNQYIQLEPMSTNPIHQTRTIDLKTTKFLIIGKAIGKFGKF